ncbi:uncharacterized protein LOC135226691 [Macrobrachium nipponense]|uniref:uncharacterized protein LOC135226691 n=1 Tax=Macrobrachium nipponense TaxID=159736 RepID=UPI0030C8452A
MGATVAKIMTRGPLPPKGSSEAKGPCSLEAWAAQVVSTTGDFELDNQIRERKLASALGYSTSKKLWCPSVAEDLENAVFLLGDKCRGGPRLENILHSALWPLRMFLRVIGIIPYVYNEEKIEYTVKWWSPSGIHTLANALYMTTLLITTTVGVIKMATTQELRGQSGSDDDNEDKNHQAIKLTGVILLSECLVNAWAQTLNVIYAGKRMCKLLNRWNGLSVAAELDPVKGLRRRVVWQIFFVAVFASTIFVMTLVGHPKIVPLVLDGVAEGMLVVPKDWLAASPFLLKFIRVMTCLVCLHIFAIFKGSLFSFTTNCHMLKNGFNSWNAQLTKAIEDIWRRRGRPRGRLGVLVQSHYHLVRMVRETEIIFSPMLQCYYASSIVILCTELYLLAYRIGTQEYAADGVITTALMTLQTTVVFVQVSLAAAAVQEAAEDSLDILRRGIPFDASERDKFNKEELTTALTGATINISGGKYFTINRPFIITVLSAVITYFIVMIQFMQPGSKSETQQSLNNTLETNVTSA